MNQALQDRFARLKALQRPAIPLEEPERISRRPGISPEIPEGSQSLAEMLGARIKSNRFGEHLHLRRWFPSSIGGESPGSFDGRALQLLHPNAPEDVADPQQWLFLDTETTGLSGGTGTYAFLVGIAWWDAGGLEVEQLFMREHSEEHSLLVALAERLAERRVLVTFNGKSFDWPLLETRYQMTRTIRPPRFRAHLDFLHPARNLWRRQLGSVRLTELERAVLGWHRGADVLSALMPQIYFDFLRGGSPAPLIPVFQHNQMDLRGLAGLACRILALLGNPEVHGQDSLELYAVSRILERRGQTGRARQLYERSIAAELPAETKRAAQSSLARLAKREGDLALARELWGSILGNSREGFEAYEQLMIYYERHAREPHRALTLARQALDELRNADRLGMITASLYRRRRARLELRLARLERKSRPTMLWPDGTLESKPGESHS